MHSLYLHRVGLARPFLRTGLHPRHHILSIADDGNFSLLVTTRVPHLLVGDELIILRGTGDPFYDGNDVLVESVESATTFVCGAGEFSTATTGGHWSYLLANT